MSLKPALLKVSKSYSWPKDEESPPPRTKYVILILVCQSQLLDNRVRCPRPKLFGSVFNHIEMMAMKRIFFVIFSAVLAFAFFCCMEPTYSVVKAEEKPKPKQKTEKAEKKPQPKQKTEKAEKKPKPTTNPSLKSLTHGLSILNQPKKKPRRAKSLSAVKRQGGLGQLSARSLLVLAQAYEQKGDYENQILTLKKLIKKNKKQGLYWLELAKGFRKLYFKTGLFKHREESVKAIQQVYGLKNKKYQEKAHLEMLELLKWTEDLEENKYAILKLLQSLIREFGIKKKYVRDICKYLYINKFYGQSLAGCSKAIKYYPKEPENYIYYALSLEDEAKKEKFLKQTAKRFLKSFFVQLKMGQHFIEQKEYQSALPYFEKVARWKPSSAPAQLGLAQALFHTGQEQQSYKWFFKACMLDKPKMLWAFKQAKSILNQKSQFNLASTFDKGITQCFLKAKYNKKKL